MSESIYSSAAERAVHEAACYAPAGTGTRDIFRGQFAPVADRMAADRLRKLAKQYASHGLHTEACRVRKEAAALRAAGGAR